MRTFLLRIRQTGSFFSTCYNDRGKHARQIVLSFDTVWIFYNFLGRKPLKYCPDVTQRASVVGFRSFLSWVPRWGPTRAGKSWVHSVKPLRYLVWKAVVSVWAEGALGRTPLLHIRQTGSFFSCATKAVASTHPKFFRVSTLYGFSTIFWVENP